MMEHPLAAPLRRGYALGPGGYARASAASLLGAGAEMCKVRVGASTRGSTRLDDEEVFKIAAALDASRRSDSP